MIQCLSVCALCLLPLAACQPLHDLDAASAGGGSAGTTHEVTVPVNGSMVSTTSSVEQSETESNAQATTGSATTMAVAPLPGSQHDGGATPVEAMSQSGVVPDIAAPTTETEVAHADADAPGLGDTDAPHRPTNDDDGGTVAPDNSETNTLTSTDPESAEQNSGVDTATSYTSDSTEGQSTEPAELPINLPNNPVTGTFTVSTEAEWEVDGTMLPTFEIITPTASYWLVKSLGMIVSMSESKSTDSPQWLAFSSGFRPLRGLPSFGTFDSQQAMTTAIDEDSRTPTHLRLHSESQAGDWRLVYDFYPSHVTLTVVAAPVPYGIAYRGVPAGALDSTDEFVRADGTSQGALVSSVVDLPGPAEWAYISDPAIQQSLLLIQHSDDESIDRFQIRDDDTALFSFGDGNLTQLPARFSFSLIDSVTHPVVEARASFIIDAIQ